MQPQVVLTICWGWAMLLSEDGFELVEHSGRGRTEIPSLLASFQRLVLAHGMDCFWIGNPRTLKCSATTAVGARPGRSLVPPLYRSRTTWPMIRSSPGLNRAPAALPLVRHLCRRRAQRPAGAGGSGRVRPDGRAGDGDSRRRRAGRGSRSPHGILKCRRASRRACSSPAHYLYARVAGFARHQSAPAKAQPDAARARMPEMGGGGQDRLGRLPRFSTSQSRPRTPMSRTRWSKLGARTRAQAVALALASFQLSQ